MKGQERTPAGDYLQFWYGYEECCTYRVDRDIDWSEVGDQFVNLHPQLKKAPHNDSRQWLFMRWLVDRGFISELVPSQIHFLPRPSGLMVCLSGGPEGDDRDRHLLISWCQKADVAAQET